MQADKIYKEKSSDLILRDIKEYARNTKYVVKDDVKHWGYVLDEKIYLSVMDGNLEIRDERATTFSWLFEVEIMDCIHTDFVKCGDKSWHVRDIAAESYIPEINKTIDKLKHTIAYLADTKLDLLRYVYWCDREKAKVDSLELVMKNVFAREPIIR